MKNPIKTALLAYGMSGKLFHAPFLSINDGFELYGVLERNIQKAVLDYPNIKTFASIDTLLADDSIELVVVNTPNNTHYEYAKQALAFNKNVLIEKPATPTTAEFLSLMANAKKVNRNVFVYQNRRFSSDILATKQVIESGKLGEIIEIHLRFDRYRNEIGLKKFKEDNLPASGIWFDLGAHLLDQLISIFGKPIHHYGIKNSYRKNSLVDDFAFMHLEFANKINAFVTTSTLVLDAQPGIIIHGTKGSFVKEFCDEQENQLLLGMLPNDINFGVEKQNKDGKLTYKNDNNDTIFEIIPSLKGNFNALFDSLYDSIRLQKPFVVDNQDIITQLELLE